MSDLNTYRFVFTDGSTYDIEAATERGAQRLYVRKHGMRRLLKLEKILHLGSD